MDNNPGPVHAGTSLTGAWALKRLMSMVELFEWKKRIIQYRRTSARDGALFQMPRLSKKFYLGSDVIRISRQLLGKRLMTKVDGYRTGGIIVETEAYAGVTDRASHAYGHRRTERNEMMFHEGGVAYVYFCYGMHWLLNFVANRADVPDAVLIRGILPTVGIETMLRRRGREKVDRRLAGGPGMLSQALGIDRSFNGESLRSDRLWIEDTGRRIDSRRIVASPRIGVDYAGPDALRPWRFTIKPKGRGMEDV